MKNYTHIIPHVCCSVGKHYSLGFMVLLLFWKALSGADIYWYNMNNPIISKLY